MKSSPIFTPTEAGVVAAFYALVISLVIYRELTLKALYNAILNAGRMTAVMRAAVQN
ncbi:MAG: TRAP transporter large permease subunit [Desulfomicrobium sp.]|uniref:TRAP transporter large permease subunit n=1 Tax=Hoeflea sp. TaxID=1940281 RepID=UPI0025BDB6B2|nr:TRAP transporter large permease subunit [Hoeflea sp.]MBV1711946.1 TRAP transporter large permease subunit [Desulfomicrobium sp.]